jgi:hypothetical protein
MIKQKTLDKYINKKFGQLTILEFTRQRNWAYFYNMQCDCGTIKEFQLNGLFRAKYPVVSCGCHNAKMQKKRLLGNTIKRMPFGESSFNALFQIYKNSAAKRGYVFNITKEQFKKITSEECFYCLAPPSQIAEGRTAYGFYTHSGIDRVDNSIGYELNNCVSCCKECNYIKSFASKNIILKAAEFFKR